MYSNILDVVVCANVVTGIDISRDAVANVKNLSVCVCVCVFDCV